MSSVDNRIVNMQFDNQQFERGIRTSVKSLDSLKKGLDLDGATKSLNNLDKAGKNFSLSGINTGVDTIASRFTNLGIMGTTVLQNLTNQAIYFAQRITSALTIDPLTDGFSEYEIKMNAIQTMLTNTANKGTSLKEINEGLAELNEYADLTIYNFAQMTDNASKFTAAGVGFEDSLITVKGMANVAAGFGVDAQKMAGATYQMTQALATGVVRLQDWNSMTQAGMGGEMIQNELKNTAKEMGIFVDASIPFRESLEKGWLTADVFVKTMGKMAKDPALLEAATNVTTFTKLLGTMKEAIGSGWAASWEEIIGDKAQSTALFTAIANGFGEVISGSAKARNEMLAFWKANGGRTAILEGIANVLKTIGSVLEPIERAFSDIFQSITGSQLVNMSKAFKDLTENFKMGDGVANDIYRTFKGLFAILSIGKQVIVAFVRGISSGIQELIPTSKGFLTITGNIGDFLVKIDSALKSSNSFANAISKIGSVLSPLGNVVKYVSEKIFKLVSSFSMFESGTINLEDTLENLMSSFSNIADKISASLKGVIDGVLEGFNTGNYSSILGIINTGVFASIVIGLKSFIDGLKKGFVGVTSGGFMSKFIETMDGLKDTLTRFQGAINAGTMVLIAVAVGILAGSLALIASLDTVKMKDGLGAITVLLLELFGSMVLFNKLMGASGITSIGKVTLAMLTLSVGVLTLSFAMRNIANLDWPQIIKGLTVIASLSLILVGTAKLLEKTSGSLITSSAGFILFGGAILVFSLALARIGALDLPTIGKGLLGIGSLMAGLALFMKVTNLSDMGLMKSVGIIALSASILILSEAVKRFGQLNTESLVQGLQAVGIILLQIVAFLKLTSGAGNVLATASSLLIISGSLLILSKAIASMGMIPMDNIGRSLLALAGALTIIGVAIKLIPNNSVILGAGLVIIASSLIILANALTIMGGMTWEAIGKGLTLLAGSLLIIGAAIKFLQTSITGIVALFMMADALSVLAPLMQQLGSMSLQQIGIALIALAGAFTVLGIAGYVLAPLSGALLAISGSLFIFSLSMIGTSTAMFIFAISLASIVATFTAGGLSLTMFSSLLGTIVATIPTLFRNLAKGLIEGTKVIGDGASVIGKALVDIFKALVVFVIDILPEIIKLITDVIVGILDSLADAAPRLIDSGVKLILALLKGLESCIYKITDVAISILVNFIKGISDGIGKIIQSGIDLAISFIEGVANGIDKNSDRALDAVEKLIQSIINLIMKSLSRLVSGITGIGENIVKGLVDGISGTASSVINKTKELGTSIYDSAASALECNSPSKLFEKLGEYITKGLGNGIDSGADKVADKSSKMTDKVIKSSAESAKKAFDASVDWIEERKYYNLLSLSEELVAWQRIQKKYTTGSEERKKADREIYRVRNEIARKGFDDSVKWITQQKEYNLLSLQEELSAWERIQQRYKEGTEERKEANLSVYRLNKEILKKMMDDQEESNRKSLSRLEKNIDERKSYNRLSLEEELRLWEANQTTYLQGSEERKKVDLKIFNLRNELLTKEIDKQEKNRKDKLTNDLSDIEDKKYYNKITLKEELDAQLKIRNLRSLNSEETKTVNREIYRLREDIRKADLEEARKEVETKKFYNKMTLQDELASELEIRKTKKLTATELQDSEQREYTLREAIRQQELSDSKEAIQDKKDLNQLTLSEELAAQKEMLKIKNLTADETKDINKEIARIEKEITDTTLDYKKKVRDVEEDANDKRIKMEEDYYAKTKEINDKLKQDLKTLTDEYNRTLTSRTQTLYSSFGLFDKVNPKKIVRGSTLIKNLQGQVNQFEDWQANLNSLASRGINDGLIKELQQMGPSAAAEVKALNTLSAPELDMYVALWKRKHEDAKSQATMELEGLRLETVSKIQQLESDAQTELKEYTKTWYTALETLRTESATQLDTLKTEWMSKIGPLRTDTEQEFITLVDNTSKTITDKNWSELGGSIVDGVRNGIKSKAAILASETAAMMIDVLNAAKNAVGIASPSKEFAKIGVFSVLGLIQGLRGYTGYAVSAVKELAGSTLNALNLAMSETSNILMDNMDANPVIRPVLDLTNITAGANRMSDLLSRKTGINVGAVNSKIPVMQPKELTVDQTNQNGSNPSSITFTQNNYSPKTLSRIDIYRQTKNQISTMKGLVSV